MRGLLGLCDYRILPEIERIVLDSDVKSCFIALNVTAPINHQARGNRRHERISASPDEDDMPSKLTQPKRESIMHYGITEERKYIYTNPSYRQTPFHWPSLFRGRDQLDIVFKLKSSLRVILARHKVHNQRVLDGKHRVVRQVLVLAVEDLRREGFVTFVRSLRAELAQLLTCQVTWDTYDDVDMGRSEGVSVHELEQLPGGTCTSL